MPRETLIKVIGMMGKNWISVDGFWFMAIEDEFGREVAERLDLKMWQKQAVLEGRRLKEVFGLGDGMENVIKGLFLSHRLHAYPDFVLEECTPDRAVFICTDCPVQEARLRLGRDEFACKEMAHTSYETTARAIDERAKLKCVYCPPDEHPYGIWCRWEMTI